LKELGTLPDSEALRRELKQVLEDKSPHVVARATKLIREREITEFCPTVEANFERFTIEPTKSDKGCFAKTAIIKCLVQLEQGSAEIFLRGLHTVQMESSYGGPVDTAVELRSYSAMGLSATAYPNTVLELVTALTDPESPVRRAAIQALGATGGLEVEPLLRFKALSGDREPQVVSDALEVLLAIAPGRSLPFVEQFLDSGDEDVAEAAALALGASRCEAAFELLTARIENRIDSSFIRTLLLSLSMLRRENSIGYLLDLVAKAPRRRAEYALQALAIHRYDDKIRERIMERLAARPDGEKLRALYETD
jgi:HEAT repeat protein